MPGSWRKHAALIDSNACKGEHTQFAFGVLNRRKSLARSRRATECDHVACQLHEPHLGEPGTFIGLRFEGLVLTGACSEAHFNRPVGDPAHAGIIGFRVAFDERYNSQTKGRRTSRT